MENLKPCKICGGNLKPETVNIRFDTGEMNHITTAKCQTCDAEFPFGTNATENQWISIRDALPEEQGYYLVYYDLPLKGNRYAICPWGRIVSLKTGVSAMGFLVDSGVTPTHWQPLPAPPTR